MSEFASVTSVGGLLPSDLLREVAGGSRELDGTSAESYGLAPGERLNDHITRSWNRLIGVWGAFVEHERSRPERDLTATTLTRQRWLTPLFDELGFGGLPAVRANEIDGKEYAISHQWGTTVPVHLLGAGVPIDRRSPGVAGAARTSPHGLVQEFLNRSDAHLWALLSNGRTLRLLRDNATLTRLAYVEFDVAAIFNGELYSDFTLLWLACHRSRFEGDPPEKCWLEQWSQHAAATGTRALDRLRDGVEAAIVSLGEGFLAHRGNAHLRDRLTSGALSVADYQRQLLRVIYRLLFLLVAESRDLLLAPGTDEVARARYRDHYSLARIARLARLRRGSAHDDLWAGLDVTMHALWRDGEPALGLSPLGSDLWSPQSVEALCDARLDNAHLLQAVRHLTVTRDAEAKVDCTVDFRNLGAEELGSVYESLLELHAEIDVAGRRFALASAAGNERKTTGSYYTPTSLINELLDSALEPVLDDAVGQADPEQALLGVSVLDPACGSGHFLIAAANRIASRLASVRSGDAEPAPDDMRRALRDVVGSCVHGIDMNPMAVELCKVSLWLEATEPGKPLSFLDHRIVCGNSLLGTTPKLLAEGIPDAAYKALEGDDKRVASADRKRNKAERQGQGVLGFPTSSIAETVRPLASGHLDIDAIPDDTTDQIASKAERLQQLRRSAEAERALLAADAWCAAFVAPKAATEPSVTTAVVRQFLDADVDTPAEVTSRVRHMAAEYGFLHPHLAFPGIFQVPDDLERAENKAAGWSGGFDVVLGNPPWNVSQLSEKEFFASRDPAIANLPGARRKQAIKDLEDSNPDLWNEYETERRRQDTTNALVRASGRFPYAAFGKLNSYVLFAEMMQNSISSAGRYGVVVPSGIATDDSTKVFFGQIVSQRRLVSLYDFENKDGIFPEVHRSYKFCLLTVNGDALRCERPEFAFFLLRIDQLKEEERRFVLEPDDFALFNPNTRNCPIFRSRRDMEIARKMYRRAGVLWRERHKNQTDYNPWGVSFLQMFNMTSDSHLFLKRAELEGDGWILHANEFVRGDERYLPLYEAKLFHQYDHRYATFADVSQADIDKGNARQVTSSEKHDSMGTILPRYWVPAKEVLARLEPKPSMIAEQSRAEQSRAEQSRAEQSRAEQSRAEQSRAEQSRAEQSIGQNRSMDAYLAFRRFARATDERTGMAMMMPTWALGDSAIILLAGLSSSVTLPTPATHGLRSFRQPELRL